MLSTFAPMSDELVESAAILFTRAADLEDNMQQITSGLDVSVGVVWEGGHWDGKDHERA